MSRSGNLALVFVGCVTDYSTDGTVVSPGLFGDPSFPLGATSMQGRTALARKGSETRERLLEVAERAVLAKGFAATSIEELIAEVGITKSGFFYHFGDKSGLAKAMLE